MRKSLVLLLVAAAMALPCASAVFAAGMTSHVVIGEQALLKMIDPELKLLIESNDVNRDAFRSGTLFPDMTLGYLKDTKGENYGPTDTVSHGERDGSLGVYNEYLQLLQAECPDLTGSTTPLSAACQEKLSFFFGMINHLIGDAPWHADLIYDTLLSACGVPSPLPVSAKGETNESWHQFADNSIDMCLAKELNGFPAYDYTTKAPQMVGGMPFSIGLVPGAISYAADGGVITLNTIGSCPSGELTAPGCYTCPSGYTNPIDRSSSGGAVIGNLLFSNVGDDNFCQKPVTDWDNMDYKGAALSGFLGIKYCPIGQLLDSGKCYKCPSGFTHNIFWPFNEVGICFRNRVLKEPATFNDSFPSDFPSLNSPTLCSSGEVAGVGCYECPSGYVTGGNYTNPKFVENLNDTTGDGNDITVKHRPCFKVQTGVVDCNLIDTSTPITPVARTTSGEFDYFPAGDYSFPNDYFNSLYGQPVNNIASFEKNSVSGYTLAYQAYAAMGKDGLFDNDVDVSNVDELRKSADKTLNTAFKKEHVAPLRKFNSNANDCDWAYANLISAAGSIDDSAVDVARIFESLWTAMANGSRIGDPVSPLAFWRLGSFNYGVYVDGSPASCLYNGNCNNNELRYAELGPGESVTTDDGLGTSTDLVEITAMSPQGGFASILATRKTQDVGETVANAIGRQKVSMRLPAALPDAPATIDFLLRGAFNGTNITILNEGQVIQNCSNGGIADPDPCIASTTPSGSDILITVLASSASRPKGSYSPNWSFAAGTGLLTDNDTDLVIDTEDNCPTDANADQLDSDGDLAGDACDPCPFDPLDDIDIDGLCGDIDPCPTDPNNDDDLDGICGSIDNCPSSANIDQLDTDGDGAGDVCDSCPFDATNDADGDGTCEDMDNCPGLANATQIDADGDGAGDACDPCPLDRNDDVDNDGLCGNVDNCPEFANPGQEDYDSDNVGAACDPCPDDIYNDDDLDGICYASDPCPFDADNDADVDGLCGDADNCPSIANLAQTDSDGDGLGDPCDACPNDADNDIDADGVCGDIDLCPAIADPGQEDLDSDGLGDACDPDIDGDGYANSVDFFPYDALLVCNGDIDQNGTVDVVDALKALRISVGAEGSSATKLKFGDVAPLVGNVPQPDNAITAADALVILRKSIGLVSW